MLLIPPLKDKVSLEPVPPNWGEVSDSPHMIQCIKLSWGIRPKRTFPESERVLWHLRGAEGDHLTERSEGRKLPQLEPRALAVLRNLKIFFGGASGGMQGGPRRGRSPITGPTLLRAAQASQSSARRIFPTRRAENSNRYVSPTPGRRPILAGRRYNHARGAEK